MEEAGDKKKRLFVAGVWRPMTEEPVHNGWYELQAARPAEGEAPKPERVKWKNGKWKSSVKGFVHWRGRELAEMSKHTARRKRMDGYRFEWRKSHEPAAKAAWILARRAVSLRANEAAYRYYLIAHGIVAKTLKRADEEWIERFTQNPGNSAKVQKQKELADLFFKGHHGRPSVVTDERDQ